MSKQSPWDPTVLPARNAMQQLAAAAVRCNAPPPLSLRLPIRHACPAVLPPGFCRNWRQPRSSIVHFQLRNLLWATSGVCNLDARCCCDCLLF